METSFTTQTRSKGLSSLKVASLYIGTVVGAGFASGQEVMQFFGHHGVSGIWGLALATALFVVYGTIVMVLGRRLRAASHLEVVRKSGGEWVGTLADAIITFFLVGAFTAMAAGAGAVFEEQFGLPAVWGSLAMVALSVVTVLLGLRGAVEAISVVAPFLLGAVFFVSIAAFVRHPVEWGWMRPEAAAVPSWSLSALVYVSFNLVLAISILAPSGTLASEAALRRGALLGGLGLGVAALAIHLGLLTAMPEAMGYDIPMLVLASRAFGAFAPVYSLVLLAEVYTTAVASLFGFVARVAGEEGIRRRTVTLATGAVAFAGSRFGFSTLVGKLYSAVGYAGIILLIALAVAYRRSMRAQRGPIPFDET